MKGDDMNHDFGAMAKSWAVFKPILTPPLTDEELDRLTEFAHSLEGEGADDESHPLHGLFLLVINLIENYEDEMFPEPEVDPIDRLKYLMEVRNLRQKNLVEIGVGSRSTVSNLLSGRRPLSKRQIGILSDYFNCSPAMFFPS